VIKRLYLADGYIQAPLDRASEDVAVDASIAALLAATLGIGDHCYLTLQHREKLEVIKVRRDFNGFHVERGQDGTDKQGFPVNSSLVYRLTSAEITDAVVFTQWNIYASGFGFATVVGGNGSWTIGAPAIHADTLGGIVTRTEGNKLVISDNIGMFGCCDSGLTGAPFTPGPIFYLTSMLYGQEAIEIMTPNPKDKEGNAIPPIDFGGSGWWLLTQPSVVDGFMLTSVSTSEWLRYGGSKTFTAPIEKYMLPTIKVGAMGDWLEFGHEASFDAPPDMYISNDLFPLEMLTFGNAIDYDKGLERYLLPTIDVLDWVSADG
jgi:hypothetical protein